MTARTPMITMTTTRIEMYTIYNVTCWRNNKAVQSHDIVWLKPDGTVASVWTNDGTYWDEYGMAPSNFMTKAIVHLTRWAIVIIDKVLKS